MFFLFAQEAPSQSHGFRDTIDALARTPLSQVVFFVLACTIIRLALYPFLTKTVPHKRTGWYSAAKFFNECFDAVIYAGVFVFMLIRPFAVQAFLIPSGSMIPTLLENDFIVANKAIYRYSDPKRGDIVVFKPPVFATNVDQRDENGEPKVDFIKRCTGLPGDLIEIHDGKLYRDGKPDPDPNKHFTGPTHGQNNDLSGLSTTGTMPDFKIVLYSGPKYKDWNGKYMPVVSDPHEVAPNYRSGGISHEYALADNDTTSCFPNWDSSRPLSDEERAVADYLRKAPPARIPKDFYLMMGDNRDGSFDGRAWGLVSRDDIIGRSEAIWLPFNRISRTR